MIKCGWSCVQSVAVRQQKRYLRSMNKVRIIGFICVISGLVLKIKSLPGYTPLIIGGMVLVVFEAIYTLCFSRKENP